MPASLNKPFVALDGSAYATAAERDAHNAKANSASTAQPNFSGGLVAPSASQRDTHNQGVRDQDTRSIADVNRDNARAAGNLNLTNAMDRTADNDRVNAYWNSAEGQLERARIEKANEQDFSWLQGDFLPSDMSGTGQVVGAGLGAMLGNPLLGMAGGGYLGSVADQDAANPEYNDSYAANQARANAAPIAANAPASLRPVDGGGGGAIGSTGSALSGDVSQVFSPTSFQADNADSNRDAYEQTLASAEANRTQRATDRQAIEDRFNSIQLDTSLADQSRADQQEGLDMQRSLFDELRGSDGGIGAARDDVVGRYDSLSLDTTLADQARGTQYDALNTNQSILDRVIAGEGQFQQTADDLTARYDALSLDRADSDESRGIQMDGLDMQTALYERLMRDDEKALSGQYSDRALASQLAMARSSGGGAAAQQLAAHRVNDNSASVYAQSQREANQQILQQYGLAGGVASAFGSQAQGLRGSDLQQQGLQADFDLGVTGGVADAQQTALNQLLQSQGIQGSIGSSIGQQAGQIRSADEGRTRAQSELDQSRAAGVAQAQQEAVRQLAARDALSSNVATAFGSQAGGLRNADESRAATAAGLERDAAQGLAGLYQNDAQLNQQETKMLGDFQNAANQMDLDWANLDQRALDRASQLIMQQMGIEGNAQAASLIAEALKLQQDTTRGDANDAEAQRRRDLASKQQMDFLLTGLKAYLAS